MDVVRKKVQQLRGRIDIQSIEGQGTTFILTLPITWPEAVNAQPMTELA